MNPIMMEQMARVRQEEILREAGHPRHQHSEPRVFRPNRLKVISRLMRRMIAGRSLPAAEETHPRLMPAGK